MRVRSTRARGAAVAATAALLMTACDTGGWTSPPGSAPAPSAPVTGAPGGVAPTQSGPVPTSTPASSEPSESESVPPSESEPGPVGASAPAPPPGALGELVDDMSGEDGGDGITATTVAGRDGFRHTLGSSDERAEFSFAKTEIGADYTYRWSLYFDPDHQESAGADIVAQWAAYPTPLNGNFPCGGVGHRLSVKDGGLRFDLQHPSNAGGSDAVCDSTQVVAPGGLKGQWLDFELQARWTDRSDAYARMTVSVGGAAPTTVLDVSGDPTFWSADREDTGPYFKMGYYNGSAAGGRPVSVVIADYQLYRR